MTGTIYAVALAAGLFVATHVLLSLRTVRGAVVDVVGEWMFAVGYSAVAFALMFWIVAAYKAAPFVFVWEPATDLRALSLVLTALACVFVVCGVATPNPSLVGADSAKIAGRGPVGIFKVTRHPLMWGIGLWGIAHLVVKGDVASMVLFGAMTVLALLGPLGIEAKKRKQLGETWDAYRATTSYVPFWALITRRTRLGLGEIGWPRIAAGFALFLVLLYSHEWLFGVDPVM